MTKEKNAEIIGTVREAAKNAAIGAVEKTVDKKKEKVRKKARKRVHRLVRGCVIAGSMFCIGYAVGVYRKEIGAYLKNRV